MRKTSAIKTAADAGYTIRYFEDATELRFRKPGASMDAMNNPSEYMRVQRRNGRWYAELQMSDRIL